MAGCQPPAGRSDVNFTVQLDVPWNAPEVFVNMESAGLHELNTESMPDVLGLRAWQPGAAVIRVMTGRDSQSVRALVPDEKVLGRGFHDVTLVDMDHIDGPDVPVAELDILRLMWPVPVVSGMFDLQFELERQRRACKQRFRGTLSEVDQAGHWPAHGKLPPRPSPALALSGVVVYPVEGYTTGLGCTPTSGTYGAS